MDKTELPMYVNCNATAIVHCDYFMHQLCNGTCAYALDIGGVGIGTDIGEKALGIGATTTETIKRLGEGQAPKRLLDKKNLDRLFKEDMRDF